MPMLNPDFTLAWNSIWRKFLQINVRTSRSTTVQFILRARRTASREALIKSASLLRRHALAAPFIRAFQTHSQLESQPLPTDGSPAPMGELMSVHYRDTEAIYVRASHDRVTVVFSTVFQEETDRIFGKVFLQVRQGASFPVNPNYLTI